MYMQKSYEKAIDDEVLEHSSPVRASMEFCTRKEMSAMVEKSFGLYNVILQIMCKRMHQNGTLESDYDTCFGF